MRYTFEDESADSIEQYAKRFIGKTIAEVLSIKEVDEIREQAALYGGRRKGHFGDLVEEYLFGIKNNNAAAADFPKAGVELKTTPLVPHARKKYVAKERLVFSMINYENIVGEEWETSSFLDKNKLLLLMFYLYKPEVDLTEYRFKLVHLLDMLSDISSADIAQIKKDWQVIVDKVKAGEAHLLSEGDTSYLSAATKASKATDRRTQPKGPPAKPRAFSFKASYLNSIIQRAIGVKDTRSVPLIGDKNLPLTIEENMQARFNPFIGKTNLEIESALNISHGKKRPKNHRRMLVNRLLGAGENKNKFEELEKADITMRVVALEPSGGLKESISFPVFKYEEIVKESWEESAFYEQLSTKRFLFVVFKKVEGDVTVLEKIRFWNFPMSDIEEARWVWEETVRRVKDKQAHSLPSIKDNAVAHVRPHGRNASDTLPTGYGTEEVKKCFWLNAKYIQQQLGDD